MCCFFDRLHIRVRKAKMMANFVNEHMGDDRTKRVFALAPVVEKGPPIEPDHVRQVAGLGHCAALRQAASTKQAEQLELALGLHLVERLLVREVDDMDDDALAELSERLR